MLLAPIVAISAVIVVAEANPAITVTLRRSANLRVIEYRLGNGAESLLVLRVLGSHPAIPPGEIEAEIVVALAVVEVVMRRCCQPVEPLAVDPARRV